MPEPSSVRSRVVLSALAVLALLAACGAPATPAPDSTPTESHAPGVQGELVTQDVAGVSITYEVIDGLAVYQGDMVLGDAEGVAALATAGALAPATAACAFDFGFGCGRWTGGVVGYGFADDWGSANAMMRARIEAAIAHWEERTSLVFVERSSGQRIVFKNSGGCSSDVGVVAITGLDVQTVRLNPSGCQLGQTIHEIGHAIGLWHEQSRMDRDAFVRVDFGAVQDGQLHQFFTHLGLGVDVGGYDYASIMHYPCRAFVKDDRDTIEPLQTGVTCADIGDGSGRPLGQRTGLSEGDVLGAYWLYPPAFTITGAAAGATAPRFDLTATFTTEPVRPEYLQWRSDRVAGVLGTGPTLTVRAAEVPAGAHTITASVVIAGVEVVARSLDVNVQNTAPSVDLGPDRAISRNRAAFVTATVVDTEDGSCPPTLCTYDWDPAFTEGSGGGSVGYTFASEGPVTVTVTVTDSGGATASDEVVLTIVDEPPVPTIATPAPGATVSLAAGGSTDVPLSGSATDANDGPGPGPGTVPCGDLSWSVSGGGASLSASTGCTPTLTVTTAGVKTLTLTAIDSQGQEASTERTITVTACEGNCEPNASFVFDTAQDFAPTSTPAPGYYLSTTISITATIGDPDVPPNNPIAYAWFLNPPFGADVPLASGTVNDPAGATSATTTLTWTPEDDVAAWDNCVTVPLEHFLRLEVTDALGGTTVVQRAFTLSCVLF
jgi:astacin